MRRLIIGTAGHIDHGKTSLVSALTGTNPDRLPEEKARGITIDLGFAYLEENGVRIGFVDVPGHEKFVRNMLAGAGGIDALLLVVAADEGVKPQTREHFSIANLLGIPAGVVALTKSDRVAAETIPEVEKEIHHLLAGSAMETASVVPVSARTGEGLARLKAALLALAVESRESLRSRPLRLPVDRAFSIAGFGPVVTGSLVSGTIAPQDHAVLLPEGRSVRVRRVEVHGEQVEKAEAGERTSVNLAGVALSELHRGQMLAAPGSLAPVTRLLVEIQLLADAPSLSTGDTASFHHFASETSVRVRVLERGTIEPGSLGTALLKLTHPVAAALGDRFVLRRPSPAVTIGGGKILDAHPPRRIEAEDLTTFTSGNSEQRLRRRVERSPHGIPLARLAREEYESESAIQAILESSAAKDILVIGSRKLFFSRRRMLTLAARIRETVSAEVKARAGATGAGRAALLEKIFSGFDPKDVEGVLQEIAATGAMEIHGEEIRLPGSTGLPAADRGLAQKILERFDRAGLEPPSPKEIARELLAKEKIVEGLISYLLREEKLTKLPGGIILSAGSVQGVIARLRASGKTTLSVPEFKEIFSLTRKMAIPLLEHLDAKKVTRRVGDVRQITPDKI